MARRAINYNLGSRSARLRLAVRPKPYYQQVAPGVTLGYIRPASPPGPWQVRELVDGRYTYRTIGAADDVGTADGRDILTHAQAMQLAGAPAAPSSGEPITVRRAMENYLAALAARSAHAQEARWRVEKHIMPTLGRFRVDRLTKVQLEAWLAGLVNGDGDPEAKRRSQDTANRIMATLKAALNAAFADDANRIPSDAAWRKVKRFRGVGGARPDHFDAAQVRRLIAAAAQEDQRFADLIEAGYLVGARYGELVGLRVADLDEARSVLVIPRGKTGARVITLSPESVKFFSRICKGRPAAAVMFQKRDGSAWGKSEQQRRFKIAAAAAGLPRSASFYSLRHSHISRAIEAGMPLSLVAELTGTSIEMLARNYAKVLASARLSLVEKTAPRLRAVK
jgi:integrase